MWRNKGQRSAKSMGKHEFQLYDVIFDFILDVICLRHLTSSDPIWGDEAVLVGARLPAGSSKTASIGIKSRSTRKTT